MMETERRPGVIMTVRDVLDIYADVDRLYATKSGAILADALWDLADAVMAVHGTHYFEGKRWVKSEFEDQVTEKVYAWIFELAKEAVREKHAI